MARQFTKAAPTTDKPSRESNRNPRPGKTPRPKKEKKEKKEKESTGRLLSRKQNKEPKQRKTKDNPVNNPRSKRVMNHEVEDSFEENNMKVKSHAEVKPFSVPSYLQYETLDTSVADSELDMYTNLLIKTVRKKNALGSITLIPLNKLCEEVNKLVAEFVYRDGGIDDDFFTDDIKYESPRQTKSRRVVRLETNEEHNS